jgi:Flp pilus assembly pilin Flp
MLILLNLMLQRVRNERGVVSVEWIILGAVIMAAIVLAFAPAFSGALTTAVAAISAQLQANVNAAGSKDTHRWPGGHAPRPTTHHDYL